MRSSRKDAEELGDPYEVENLKMSLDENKEFDPFRINDKEVARGHIFSELPMSNPNTVEVYRNESNSHILLSILCTIMVVSQVIVRLDSR